MTTKVFAPAKVNLTLHVTGQRNDGYHLLDSLVVFVDVGDRLDVSEASEMSLEVTGPYLDGVPQDSRNLVWKAAALCGLTAKISLEKNLPNAAGIGGGSADAAALVRAAAKLGYEPQAEITTLGADVPVCASSAPQRMTGIGEVLSVIANLPDIWMVLVNPKVQTPTPAIFSALEMKANDAMADKLPSWQNFDDFCVWLGDQRNDLQAPATELQPVIRKVLDALSGATLARMSGSGATCFGLYPSESKAAAGAREIQGANPNWWVAPAKVLST